MPFIKSIRYFFNYRMHKSDRVLIYLLLLNVMIGTLFIVLNKWLFHYSISSLFNLSPGARIFGWGGFFWKAIVPSLFFFFYGIYIREQSPRAAAFIWGLGMFPLCFFATLFIGDAIEGTPFSPIDPLLVRVDHALGIDVPTLMTWTYHHSNIHHLFTQAYNSLILELILIPLGLTMFSQQKPLTIFYLAQLSTILIGTMIYYFFPTMAPSGIFHSPYFTIAQKDTSLRFYELHHYLKITIMENCGLVAFPSFHVIWAILLTNCFRNIKALFYPTAIWNAVIIISTVFLGWHYFADVIGGAILAVAGIWFARRIIVNEV